MNNWPVILRCLCVWQSFVVLFPIGVRVFEGLEAFYLFIYFIYFYFLLCSLAVVSLGMSVSGSAPRLLSLSLSDRFVGLVVKRSPREREIRGLIPSCAVGIFPGRVIPVT